MNSSLCDITFGAMSSSLVKLSMLLLPFLKVLCLTIPLLVGDGLVYYEFDRDSFFTKGDY